MMIVRLLCEKKVSNKSVKSYTDEIEWIKLNVCVFVIERDTHTYWFRIDKTKRQRDKMLKLSIKCHN